MRSLVSFLVLVLLAGCGSLKGCGGSASAPASASAHAPSPAASKPSAADSPEGRFAKQYLVIVHSSPTPGEGQDIVEKLRAAGLGSEVKRLSSTPFAFLRPCLEVVVAGAFADKQQALGLSDRLEKAGVKSYLKNTGALAEDRERREAGCREQAQLRAAVAARVGSPGEPRFMDLRGPRSFVLLSDEPKETPGAKLQQVGEDRGFWMAALREDPTGRFKKGDTFDVYDARGLVKSGCHVKEFASLNRGIPHFTYFQEQETPAAPGCGGAWPVAELDCSLVGTRAMDAEATVFALPGGSPAPRFLSGSEPLPEPLKASQEAGLRALADFAKTHAEGEAHAREQGQPLQESLSFQVFGSGQRQVVVGLAHFRTGEGHNECGGPDFAATVWRAVVVEVGGKEFVISSGVNGGSIVAVMDLKDDGHLGLITRGPDLGQMSIVREDASPVTATFLANCDCGC